MTIITPPEMKEDAGYVTAERTITPWWMIRDTDGHSFELHESEIENLWKLIQERKADELQVG